MKYLIGALSVFMVEIAVIVFFPIAIAWFTPQELASTTLNNTWSRLPATGGIMVLILPDKNTIPLR